MAEFFSYFEATGLFCLTFLDVNVRLKGLNLLEKLNSVFETLIYTAKDLQEENDFAAKAERLLDENVVPLYSIIEKYDELIVRAAYLQSIEGFEEESNDNLTSVAQSFARATKEDLKTRAALLSTDQRYWTICYAELLRIAAAKKNRNITLSFGLLFNKLQKKALDLLGGLKSTCPLENMNLEELQTCRNLFVTSAVTCKFAEEELIAQLIESLVSKLLENLSKNTHKLIVYTLGNVPWPVIQVVLEQLSQIYDSVLDPKSEGIESAGPGKKEKRRKQFLAQISHVYRLLAEHFRAEHFVAHPELRIEFDRFLEKTHFLLQSEQLDGSSAFNFFSGSSIESVKLEMLELWNNFCIFVRRVAEEYFVEPSNKPLDVETRVRLLKLMIFANEFASSHLLAAENLANTNAEEEKANLFAKSKQKKVVKNNRRFELLKNLGERSLSAFSTLMFGEPLPDESGIFTSVIEVINKSFESQSERSSQDFAALALKNLILSIPDVMIPKVLNVLFSTSTSAALRKQYFLVLGEVWIFENVSIRLSEAICLIIYHVSLPYSFSI
jgi:hypothetical protein